MPNQREVTVSSFRDKPVWFNIINSVWKGTYPIGTKVNLDKDHLIRLARKQTGLQYFGDDFWEEPLERLLDAIEHEAQLHPVGRFITQQRMTSLLAIRLRAEEAFRKYPAILEQELYPVQLICGLQRTGTTKLQRLLSADPDNRVLYSWEAINPVPLSDQPDEIEQRKKAARLSEKALRLMAPGFFSIHPVEYEKPEEDILLLDTTFLSTTPEATMFVPSYAAWLEQTDQSPAYAYLVKLLKYLQYQRPGKRWVLKSPHHMEFPDLAKKHFKDVHYIWTHRNITESLPSFLSMVAHSQTIFSDQVTLERVVNHWVRKTGYMLSKGIQFRKENPQEKYTDVMYPQLITSPMAVLDDIYRFGEPVSEGLLQKFQETEQQNKQYRYGRHTYKLEDFGIRQEDVNEVVNIYKEFVNTLK
ncbi:MAG TPA: sulfotransferase [Saprospiraceae bacterium]|nr:sulfotransferase [Saprospiraceae bacterium]